MKVTTSAIMSFLGATVGLVIGICVTMGFALIVIAQGIESQRGSDLTAPDPISLKTAVVMAAIAAGAFLLISYHASRKPDGCSTGYLFITGVLPGAILFHGWRAFRKGVRKIHEVDPVVPTKPAYESMQMRCRTKIGGSEISDRELYKESESVHSDSGSTSEITPAACPHCSASGILPMSGNRCPNCKKPLQAIH